MFFLTVPDINNVENNSLIHVNIFHREIKPKPGKNHIQVQEPFNFFKKRDRESLIFYLNVYQGAL